MKTPSDTPRTDQEAYPEGEGQAMEVVRSDFARTLERENAIFLESATKAQIRARKLEIAAKQVIEARYTQGDRAWDTLKEAIGELEGLLKP